MDKLLNTIYKWNPSNSSGSGEAHVRPYIHVDIRQTDVVPAAKFKKLGCWNAWIHQDFEIDFFQDHSTSSYIYYVYKK
jgi:hypothetical protein